MNQKLPVSDSHRATALLYKLAQGIDDLLETSPLQAH